MAHISVSVRGQPYTLACDDGEEDHLRSLVRYVERHVTELGGSAGGTDDARLFFMAALMVADELSSAVDRLEELETEFEALKEARGRAAERSDHAERDVAAALDRAARRLESIAHRVAQRGETGRPAGDPVVNGVQGEG